MDMKMGRDTPDRDTNMDIDMNMYRYLKEIFCISDVGRLWYKGYIQDQSRPKYRYRDWADIEIRDL